MSGYSSSQRGGALDDELEELGEEAIIAQEQRAHVPAPRRAVKEETRSVVISDVPPPASGYRRTGRYSGRNDATVVIRDRRRVDAMRQALLESYRPAPAGRNWLLWVSAAFAAFAIGGVVAAIASRATSHKAPVIPSSSAVIKNSSPEPGADSARSSAPAQASPQGASFSAPRAVDLKDLPVERGSQALSATR